MTDRRKFLQNASALGMATVLGACTTPAPQEAPKAETPANIRRNPIGVSTYSFWQFNGPKEEVPIEMCIDKAAAMGFDGIELLLVQMTSEENSYLQNLKKRAFHAGLDLMGFSTHQGFVYPEKEKRDENITKTIRQISYYITQFPLPVITGIGHERDESVVDLVANSNCKTPTAVAEFIIDSAVDFDSELNWLKERISREARKQLNEQEKNLFQQTQYIQSESDRFLTDRFNQLKSLSYQTESGVSSALQHRKLPLKSIESTLPHKMAYFFQRKKNEQDKLFSQSHHRVQHSLIEKKHELALFEKQSAYLDPKRILDKGYSISTQNGTVIKNSADIDPAIPIRTQFRKGYVTTKIIKE